MIKGPSDFMEGSFSLNLTTLPGLVAIGIVAVEIVFLIYHEASLDRMFKGLWKFEGEVSHSKSPPRQVWWP